MATRAGRFVPGAVSEADVAALLQVLQERSEDSDVPEPERRKARLRWRLYAISAYRSPGRS
jgi:hypothetical protein